MVEQVEIKEAETTSEKPVEQVETPRPEGLPEKFKSVEDMAKSYSELESKLGANPPSSPTAVLKPSLFRTLFKA